MQIRTGINNQGISISVNLGQSDNKTLTLRSDADQNNPRNYYVYAHIDGAGKIFYIGKGIGRRAWAANRHPIYERYVKNHLGGKFTVKILHDNLTSDDAEKAEASWIEQQSEGLVNWVNMGRHLDYVVTERIRGLRDANQAAIANARHLEKSDPEGAIAAYIKALDDTAAYAFLADESGLVAQLLAEEAAEIGFRGELDALDRLTLCLVTLGRAPEAQSRMLKYFSTYRRDEAAHAAERIRKRVEKAILKTSVARSTQLMPKEHCPI